MMTQIQPIINIDYRNIETNTPNQAGQKRDVQETTNRKEQETQNKKQARNTDQQYSEKHHNNQEKHEGIEETKRYQTKKRRNQLNKRTFGGEVKRTQLLNTQPGNRTISIASANPDNFITQETRLTITHMLKKKIHIASIQETHIPHDQNYKFNGYRIITSKAQKHHDGMPIGGVAILIHEDLEQHIAHIHRVNHRIMKIALRIEYPTHANNHHKHICTTPRQN